MNLFELFVKIGVDNREAIDGMDETGKEASKLGEKMKKGLSAASKVAMAAVAAGAGAVVALTKSAVQAYGEYEQLIGGVETLFKNSAGTVLEYANNAYKTAGLSANEYMETVTSFSASLLQSLSGDTEEAAKIADLAITDMSDNANKMGTDMSSIQWAYQGFAKQNFTMLDNLKLGYGGTKEEMQRLLDKANELNAQQGIITNYQISSYADIVNAIHVVQTELGITGTTALEASSTIQGSVNSMKSAWKNLVVGIADDTQDFDQLMDNFVDSTITAGENIIPRIKTSLKGVVKLIKSASTEIVPLVVETIVDNLPELVSSGIDIMLALVDGILSNVDSIIDCIGKVIDVVIDKITNKGPDLIAGGIKLVVAIAVGIINGIPKIVEKAPEIIAAIVTGLVNGMDALIEAGAELLEWIWEGLKSGFSDLWEKAKEIGKKVVDGIKQGISNAWNGIKDWFNNLWDSLFGNLSVDVSEVTSGASNYNRPTAPVSTPSRKSGGSGVGGTVINQYIQGTKQSPSEIAGATKAMFAGARYALR